MFAMAALSHSSAVVTCVGLSVPSNGQRTYLDAGRKFGNRVEFSCNTGSILRGSRYRTCQFNGEWSGTPATCHRKCACGMCTVILCIPNDYSLHEPRLVKTLYFN